MLHKSPQVVFRWLERARARARDMGRRLLRDKADDEGPETLGRIRDDGEEVCVRAIEAHASEQGREGQAFLQGQAAGRLFGAGAFLQRQERGKNLVSRSRLLHIDVRPGAGRLLPVPDCVDAGRADTSEYDAHCFFAAFCRVLVGGLQRNRDIVDREYRLVRSSRLK